MNTEINLNEPFGYDIYQTIVKYELKNNLEIGSWDGEGSTFCFVEAMKQLSGQRSLICIEIDVQKFNILKSRYQNIDYINPINASSINYDEMIYKNFDDVWTSPYNKIKNIYSKEVVKTWFDRDIQQLKQTKESAISSLKIHQLDSVLIDGSEFTGYSEYFLLKDKTKVFFLDDVHKAFKCYQIYDELKNDPKWTLLSENSSIRNGYAIFIKK
jgi:hypothetical protein